MHQEGCLQELSGLNTSVTSDNSGQTRRLRPERLRKRCLKDSITAGGLVPLSRVNVVCLVSTCNCHLSLQLFSCNCFHFCIVSLPNMFHTSIGPISISVGVSRVTLQNLFDSIFSSSPCGTRVREAEDDLAQKCLTGCCTP